MTIHMSYCPIYFYINFKYKNNKEIPIAINKTSSVKHTVWNVKQ